MKLKISQLKPLLHRVKFYSDDLIGGYVSRGVHEATVISVEPVDFNQWRIRTPGYWHRVHGEKFEYEVIEDELEEKTMSAIPARPTLTRGRSTD